MERPEWAPSTEYVLIGPELVSYWHDQAMAWRHYSEHLEKVNANLRESCRILKEMEVRP